MTVKFIFATDVFGAGNHSVRQSLKASRLLRRNLRMRIRKARSIFMADLGLGSHM